MFIVHYAMENELFSSVCAHTHTHTTVQNSALHGAKVVLVTQVCVKTMFVLFLNAENNKLGNVCMTYQFLHICSTISSIFSNS